MLNWVALDDNRAWRATSDTDGKALVVRKVGGKAAVGEHIEYGAYRNGRYLGSEPTLEAAQARAERGEAKPRAARDVPAEAGGGSPPANPETDAPGSRDKAAEASPGGPGQARRGRGAKEGQGGQKKHAPDSLIKNGGPPEKKAKTAPPQNGGKETAPTGRRPGRPAGRTKTPLNSDARIVILKRDAAATPGSKRAAQWDLAKRSATAGDFKKGGGIRQELELFVHRCWIKLQE